MSRLSSWWYAATRWVGVGSTVVFLYLSFQRADWHQTVASLRQADLPLVGVGCLALGAAMVAFAWRWKLLLSGSARVLVTDAFCYLMIGYFANSVLPMRLGDVTRAVLMGRRYRTGTGVVLGTVALERVLDVATVLAIGMGLSFVMDFPETVRLGMTAIGMTVLAGVGALLLLAHCPTRFRLQASSWLARLPAQHLLHLESAIWRFADGVATVRDWRTIVLAGGASMLAWGAAGVGTIAWVSAFHLQVPAYAGLFVLAVVNLGSAVPSSPGGLGVYHYLAMLSLSVWVQDRSATLAYAVATHGLSIATYIAAGGASLLRVGMSAADLAAIGRSAKTDAGSDGMRAAGVGWPAQTAVNPEMQTPLTPR